MLEILLRNIRIELARWLKLGCSVGYIIVKPVVTSSIRNVAMIYIKKRISWGRVHFRGAISSVLATLLWLRLRHKLQPRIVYACATLEWILTYCWHAHKQISVDPDRHTHTHTHMWMPSHASATHVPVAWRRLRKAKEREEKEEGEAEEEEEQARGRRTKYKANGTTK